MLQFQTNFDLMCIPLITTFLYSLYMYNPTALFKSLVGSDDNDFWKKSLQAAKGRNDALYLEVETEQGEKETDTICFHRKCGGFSTMNRNIGMSTH